MNVSQTAYKYVSHTTIYNNNNNTIKSSVLVCGVSFIVVAVAGTADAATKCQSTHNTEETEWNIYSPDLI